MSIYVTSDTHFMHDKSFLYQPRGFQSVEDMNEAIVERWNKIVTPEDTVYHLGDVGLMDDERTIKLVKRLNGHIFLAFGNHDSEKRIERYTTEGLFEDIQMGYRLRVGKDIVYLTHHLTNVINVTKHPRTWNLYGHTHSEFVWDDMLPWAYQVGMDSHNCYPILLDTCIAELREYNERIVKNAEV